MMCLLMIIDSWVSGVEMVKSADLKIEWWARDRMRRNGYAENVSDADIKDALETSYLYDPRISSFNPEIKVNNGRVTLKGVVSNLRAKEAAAEDAKNVVGVWQVRNHLKVQPPIIPENSELRGWVAQALINDPYIDRSQIKINTSYGIVYLSGTVHTSFEKYHAELVTERVRGVTTVVMHTKAARRMS
ncbi:MAG: BON domain-containing protein [Calditrichaceae bacterium]